METTASRLSPAEVAGLVERARSGEETAFAELARRHLRALYAVALSVLRQPADAEDVAQEAMLVAFERLDSCRDPRRFSGWLLQIGRNRALNALSARRARRQAAERLRAERPGATPARDATRRQQLLTALSALSDAQREVVLLHDLEGWKHREIATALAISEGMSRQHLFAARKRMREVLAEPDAPAREAEHG